MESDLIRTIASYIQPPGGMIILITFGLLMWLFRLRKFAATCIVLGTLLLYFASTPFVAYKLLDSLQYQYKVIKEIPNDIQAIVVLSGGRQPIAREYDNLDTAKANTLERIRYAAKLAKQSQLPILAVGGSVHNERDSEASIVKSVLKKDFGVDVKWLEEKSKNTFENAKFAKRILNENSISKFLLVTHAYHMPRAIWCFEEHGLKPLPAPTVFYKKSSYLPENNLFIPRASALVKTRTALHEHIGKLWYKFFSK